MKLSISNEGLEYYRNRIQPVSYTHLDVYKRQANQSLLNVLFGQQQKAASSQNTGCRGTRDTLTRKLIFGDPVSGWPSLVCIITFVGGIQLFCMGIMGQYLSKAYICLLYTSRCV